MDKKLAFFIDIDETLMTRNKIPAENISAITAAQAKGHKFFINTGRSFGFIPPEVKNAVKFDGFVAAIGATVIVGDKIIESDCFDFDDMFMRVKPFADAGYPMHVESFETAYAVNLPAMHYVTGVDSFDCLKNYRGDRFSKATVFCTVTDADRARFTDSYQLIQNPRYVEISVAGHSKASGMQKAANYLGIPIENTVAIGDGINDLTMLNAAGVSVTLENAPPEIQKVCRLVVPSVERAGVAKAIELLTGVKG